MVVEAILKLKKVADAAAVVVFACALFTTAGSAPGAPNASSSVKNNPLYKEGSGVVNRYSCDSCHGPDLKGDSGTPDITSKGVLRHYTSDSFATLMNKDIGYDGKKRSVPMAGKLKPDEINAVYFYLSNQ